MFFRRPELFHALFCEMSEPVSMTVIYSSPLCHRLDQIHSHDNLQNLPQHQTYCVHWPTMIQPWYSTLLLMQETGFQSIHFLQARNWCCWPKLFLLLLFWMWERSIPGQTPWKIKRITFTHQSAIKLLRYCTPFISANGIEPNDRGVFREVVKVIRHFEVARKTRWRWLSKCIVGLFWDTNLPPCWKCVPQNSPTMHLTTISTGLPHNLKGANREI